MTNKVHIQNDLDDDGVSNQNPSSPLAEVDQRVKRHDLVVFITKKCPFCLRVKTLFSNFNIEPLLLDISEPQNEARYQAAVAKHAHDTVPMVLYNDVLIGGCDSTCAAIERGDFARLVNLPSANAVPRPGRPRRDLVAPALFNFPVLVDIWPIRLTSFIVMSISIVLIVFREKPWAWWVAFGMTLDYMLRVFFGGTASMIGSTSAAILSWKEEELVPGPPKQFAAFVGGSMYLAGTICFHVGNGSTVTEYGGCFFMAVMALFAGLEAFINFCAGCYVFGFLVSWGIVKETIYQPYTDSYEYTAFATQELNAKVGWVDNEPHLVVKGSAPAGDKSTLGWRRKLLDDRYRPNHQPLPRPQHVRELLPAGAETTDVDITYKFPKFEDTQREKWSWKYVTFPDFGSCMGTSGFALLLKFINMNFDMPSTAWKVIALFAAVQFGVLILCLMAKAVMWPKKIYMDLQQPMKRNTVALIPITCVIFSGLAVDVNHNLSMVMFWCGAPAIAVLSILTVAYYIRNYQSGSTYNPSVLIPILGLYVVSLVIPLFVHEMTDSQRALGYLEAAWWYWGAAFFLNLIHVSGTMYHGVFFHWNADKMRPSIAVWMGGSFITCVSWMFLNGDSQFDGLAWVFFVAGVFMYLTILFLIYPGNWLLRGRFDMANWGACFPLSMFGVASIMYYKSQQHAFAYGLCWVSWISAGYATYCCLMHSIRLLLQQKWPGPHPECSPLMFNKFLHDGFREVLARLRMESAFHPHGDEKANADTRLLAMASDYLHLLKVHTDYEMAIFHPEFKAVSRAQGAAADEQHNRTLQDIATLSSMVVEKDCDALRKALPDHCDLQYDFFQWEEDHLAPLVHKGMNGKIATIILERIWETVPMEDLERLVVMAVRFIPKQVQRAMFVKAITAALPERSQQIGLWLYRGLANDALGDMKLSLLFEDVPQIIPRGHSGWTRQM